MPRSEYVQSILRGVDVVELVAQSERGLSLAEVCQALGLKQPTAHNIIRTLVARGLVEKSTSPVRYRLGPAVGRLARAGQSQQLLRRAGDVMQRLFDQMRRDFPAAARPPDKDAKVTFAMPAGCEVLMALRLALSRPGLVERPNTLFDPYRSAVALVFQAYWTPEELAAFRRAHPFNETGLPVWRTVDRLDKYLAQVRTLGYSIPPLYPSGELRMAVPVFGHDQELVGALGLGVWTDPGIQPRRQFIAQLVEAAGRIAGP